MSRWSCFALAAVVTVGLVSAAAYAATDTKTVTVSATVNAKARLTLGANTVTFPDADPATTSSIAANENAIAVTADARTGANGNATLTVLAATDLTSGSDTIGINKITWTATGSGYQGGTLSKSSAQTVGSWTGPGTHTGTVSYALANSYDYPTGNYSANVTYTLTAP